ncbi:hypothetical protein HYV82_03415, partial [Candidatus Woesearchaeota archaeon]|nr:hypothetical protein [Candidatus Woesearchaeota archaeon]
YTLHSDPLIFSSYIVTPSYLSLWTALRYYNMTAQQPYGIFVMSPVTRKSIKIDASTITFAATNHMFGYKRERYGDFDIHLAEPEKAVVDALLFKLPVEDIKLALENEELDFSRMAEYATRTGNISLIKRLGYLLESRTGSSYGLAPMDRNYVPLDYLGRPKGRKNRKWRLIVKR